MALTLHEKGRSVLNKRNYAEALLLLLEAEKEFRYLFWQYFVGIAYTTIHLHPQWLNINDDDNDDDHADDVKGNVFKQDHCFRF